MVVAVDPTELDGLLAAQTPDYAVVDLKLAAGSGLECVKLLHASDPKMKIVVLTGFASIATAVEAIKLGACHYLAKPSNTDDIEAAFRRLAQASGHAEQQAGAAADQESERRPRERDPEGVLQVAGMP